MKYQNHNFDNWVNDIHGYKAFLFRFDAETLENTNAQLNIYKNLIITVISNNYCNNPGIVALCDAHDEEKRNGVFLNVNKFDIKRIDNNYIPVLEDIRIQNNLITYKIDIKLPSF